MDHHSELFDETICEKTKDPFGTVNNISKVILASELWNFLIMEFPLYNPSYDNLDPTHKQ